MKLDFIPIEKLSISKANMRDGTKPPDIADILPSVRARGILVPLLVRPNCEAGCFEIVAGRRRFHAALALKDERSDEASEPLPCAILGDTDDAAALEASLIENVARLDPDEVSQWETFTRLVKEGRSLADISATFGIPEAGVKRVLALGNLLPRIRDLYRKDEIDAATVRHLTLATKRQQKEWLALADSEDAYAPRGQQLKSWLFGGSSISTDKALFDLQAYKGATIANLFGDGAYFADAEQFWAGQNAAIEERKAGYLAQGWSSVVIVPPSDYFQSWDYEKRAKRKGGKIYVDVRSNGEVTFHEGYLSRREAKRMESGEGEAAPKPVRPEVSGPMQAYIDLHRHAAVRAELAAHPSAAFRLMVAHAIIGSPLWNLRVEPQHAHNEATQESVETCAAEASFDARRRSALALLDFSPEEPHVTHGGGSGESVSSIFLKLIALGDEEVMDIAAVCMGETLSAGSEEVEAVGLHLGVDMARSWAADEAFFALLRDRESLLKLVAELAGEEAATANEKEKAKGLKAIVNDCLAGTNGRAKREGWVPRWMAFPPASYTTRGGVGTVGKYNRIAFMFEPEKEAEALEAA